MNHYAVPCYLCDGNGFFTENDKDDYPTRHACPHCYRGRVTVSLKPADEDKLLSELTARIARRP